MILFREQRLFQLRHFFEPRLFRKPCLFHGPREPRPHLSGAEDASAETTAPLLEVMNPPQRCPLP